ncbi:uncharacterized protein LOC127750093 [Frankliniella occidentalis]|uniref:Uncharacterized protein LOC127750093 n=1 Tax=Frankliniella occidentalis TaxID=133901 RepID=A0A9C6UCN1_FRAOC|nr:uncharacterized protein LOC127750093 [Frankliniella occidentalis]
MLTATKAGAIPIGILLNEAQTTESYERAFSLFKEIYPNAFGGKEYPQVFMTDNSVPAKSAIHANWPQSIQLLCAFHVGHAEWLWLQSKYDQKSRQPLMQGFRKEQWVYLFRSHFQIGGHQTNNYAEASVQILKDVILQRTKAFNAVALFDYISETWDTYLTTKLCRFAYKRNRKPILLYNDLGQRLPAELADKIIVIDEDTYRVPSSVTGEATYEVVASAGSCMCKAGAAGAFCKHQALVHEKFNCMFPNHPLITSADRYLMGLLAMGSECPEKEFFLDPKEPLENLERDLQLINQQEELIQLKMGSDEVLPSNEAPTAPLQNHESGDENDDGDGEEVFKTFVENWERVFTLGTETNKKGFLKFMKRANNALSKVKNSNKAFEGMMRTSAVLKVNIARYGRKILVGVPSIARRRPGLTKGTSRVKGGRPAGAVKAKQKKKNPKAHQSQRQRKLGASVAANKPHYRKHYLPNFNDL